MLEIYPLLDDFHKTRDLKKYVPILAENTKLITAIVGILERQEKYPYSEYGSWLLMHIGKKHTSLLVPYYERLIDMLFVLENQSVLRNVANVLNELPKTDYREAELLDLLINFLMDKSHKVALHVNAIYLLIPLCKKYPELRQEIQSIFSLYKDRESPALRVAFRRFNNSK